MADAILVALSRIVTCLADEACISAIGNLSDKVTSINELPSKLEDIKRKMIILANDILNMNAEHQYLIDEIYRSWTMEVCEVAWHVEDMMARYLYHALHLHREGPQTMLWKGTKYATSFSQLSDEFRQIDREIDMVEQMKAQWLLPPFQPYGPLLCLGRHARVPSSDHQLIGSDCTMDYLLNFLMEDKVSKLQLKVLSIVGFAGIGKTALASGLYGRIRAQFECSAFVTVSKTPDVEWTLQMILAGIGQLDNSRNIEEMDGTQLIREIRQDLKDKRYIVVLDDLWATEVWETIKHALPDDNCGSRLMATTRLNAVGKTCCPGHCCVRGPRTPRIDAKYYDFHKS